jgi:hypothetical protein
MQYMLLICNEERQEQAMSESELAAVLAGYGRFHEEAGKAGVLRGGERLRPAATATTVRVRGGKTLVTDGPFAETKEQIGGYYLLDVKDLDEALKWAAMIPSARDGSIEVRPIWPPEEYMG